MSAPAPAPLARRLREAHAAPGPGGGREGVRPDHAVAGEDGALLALAALGRLGTARVAADFALVAPDRLGARAGFHDADVVTALRARARGLGMHVARPGAGPAGDVYVERAAAPGRLAFACGADAAAAGALGAVALAVDACEWAAALHGRGVEAWPAAWAEVALRGAPVPGVCGADAALALAARAGETLVGRGVEFGGEGVTALSVEERMALARGLVRAGAAAALFPADAAARAWLRARGREADWRPFEAEPADGAPSFTLDLGALEPMAAPEGRAFAARPLLASAGLPVTRVVVGGEASLDDLARLATRLAGRDVARGTALVVTLAGRARHEAAEGLGVLEALRAAGAQVVGAEAAPDEPREGLMLACAGGRAAAGATWLGVSLEAAAAAALAGRVADPRGAFAPWPGLERPPAVAATWVEPPGVEDGAGLAPTPAGAVPTPLPVDGPLRGVLLMRAVGPLSPADLLPGGARLEPLRGDVGALAAWALADLAPGFAARARAAGGGFVSAGPGFGAGAGDGERAALALAALGVRAVLARGFDARFRARLLRAGVLPLRLERASDLAACEPGDLLELPGLPEALGADRPLAVRNLTRGVQCLARHDLDASGAALARAGGLLGWAALDAAPAGAR
uniref:Aconitate hydratase n=1 Tax=Eiseniibacteriota bacterium TaxID=2212470 RepID=A0A832I3C9_UNCEI